MFAYVVLSAGLFSSQKAKEAVNAGLDANHLIPSVNWTLTKLTTINGDDLLDPNELFEITVDMASTGNVTISPYQSFALEIKPPNGPVNHVERAVPGRVSQYVNLR
ncbi:MAG: hypothetical protein WC370_07420 [Dehalococcoidales bacterium]